MNKKEGSAFSDLAQTAKMCYNEQKKGKLITETRRVPSAREELDAPRTYFKWTN